MNRTALVSLWLFLGASISLCNAAPFDESVTIEYITHDVGVKGLRAHFLVEATREEIWDLLTDYERFKETFQGIREMQVLEENENGAVIIFKIRVSMLPFNYTLQRNYERPNERLSWRKIDGNFRHISGSWEIRPGPSDGIHEVIYESFLDVGFLVPSSWARNRAAKEVDKMVVLIRSRLAAD